MKIPLLVWLCIFSAVAASVADAQEPEPKAMPNPAALAAAIDHTLVRTRYDNGKALAQAGDHAAALNEFLWLFDTGMRAVPSFGGVRTSFLLGDIGKLMPSYPPAREALVERCDEAERRLLAEPDDRGAVSDFAALCATLNDNDRLLKAFDALPASDPRRRAFGLRAYRVLLPMQRYADALSAMPYESMLRLVEMRASRPGSVARDPRAVAASLRNDIRAILGYIEVLAGAGELESARAMIGKLLEIDASADTERALAESLKRAGQPDLLKAAP